jgi:hypothetical protein
MKALLALSIPERLAALAGLAALVASLAGFVPGLYRDRSVVVEQSHGYDVGNLVAVVVLGVALAASARGSVHGRLVAIGALGCLLYGYVTYAFLIVLNPATPLYIAVLGCGGWSLATGLASVREEEVAATVHLRRRATGTFLSLLALFFALNWLRQITGSIASGALPPDLAAAGWPMNPIYVLDLAFVLPLMALTGLRVLQGRPGGTRFAVPLLVSMPPLAVAIVAMSVSQALAGQALDPVLVGIFVVVSLMSGALVVAALAPPSPRAGAGRTAVGAR